MSDPYRDEVQVLKERLGNLEKRHAELREKVERGRLTLQKACDFARAAERKQRRTSVDAWRLLEWASAMAVLLATFLVASNSIAHHRLGRALSILLLLLFSTATLYIWLGRPWATKKRRIDSGRYDGSTVPAHLRAHQELLEQERLACQSLEDDIDEAARVLAEHDAKQMSK